MVATEPTPTVVCDAGPLIHLDELECLDLLSDFTSVIVPDAVWQEVERHRPQALAHPGVRFNRMTPSTAPAPPRLEALSRLLPLHRGETEALVVALSVEGAMLLTDDTAARLAATSLGVEARGRRDRPVIPAAAALARTGRRNAPRAARSLDIASQARTAGGSHPAS